MSVAASEPHSSLVRWALETAQRQSVHRHAQGVTLPASDAFQTPAAGAEDYRAMCEGCHGAPGVERLELGRGLRPQAPDLAEAVARMDRKALFWVVKHGVRMTGMPAWGETHGAEARAESGVVEVEHVRDGLLLVYSFAPTAHATEPAMAPVLGWPSPAQ